MPLFTRRRNHRSPASQDIIDKLRKEAIKAQQAIGSVNDLIEELSEEGEEEPDEHEREPRAD